MSGGGEGCKGARTHYETPLVEHHESTQETFLEVGGGVVAGDGTTDVLNVVGESEGAGGLDGGETLPRDRVTAVAVSEVVFAGAEGRCEGGGAGGSL